MTQFHRELERLINAHSMENASDTPDFILAEYLVACLRAFNNATIERTRWYEPTPPDEEQPIDAAPGGRPEGKP